MIMVAGKSSSGPVSQPSHRELAKGNDDGTIVTAKIGLIATLVAALIAGAATVLVAVINNDDREPTSREPPLPVGSPAVVGSPPVKPPEPTCPTCAPGGMTFTQQVNSGNAEGTTSFRNPYASSGSGPRVRNGQRVEVVCRLRALGGGTLTSGWWYLIDSPPWNREFYTPANSYLNGDPVEGTSDSAVDYRVPECRP